MPVVVQQNFRVAGTGSYLPNKVVTAEDLDARAGWSPGWCRQHSGVATRFECRPPESMITMGVEAIQKAIADANLDLREVDAIIDCSTSQYRPIPCNAVHYQQALGPSAYGIPCFDVQSTCLGSLVALNLINGLFASKAYRTIVLVASESGMGGLNFQQPESASLIGDGAAALVLQEASMNRPFIFAHETYSEFIDLCKVEAGGHRQSVFEYQDSRKSDYLFSMDGPNVFRVALKHLKPMIQQMRVDYETATTKQRVASLHYLPHQASPKALRAVRCQLKIPDSRFHVAVHEVGNMVAASLPYMLDRTRKNGAVVSGEPIMLLGTSAGYSQAALIFEL